MKYELYGGDVELDFNEGKHVYTVDGEKVVSVTGVTGIIDKSGPLMWWAVGQCVEYIKQEYDPDMDEVAAKQFWHNAARAHLRSSQTAKDIGTLAHEWIEDYLLDKDPVTPKNKKLRSTIESWLEWAHDNDIKAIETEFKVYSRECGYAGTCDFDGLVNGERAIVDWKTGKAVYPEHWLQTAAYQYAREEEFSTRYDCRWVVVLPKDGGKVIARRRAVGDFEADFMGFCGALDLYNAVKRKKK